MKEKEVPEGLEKARVIEEGPALWEKRKFPLRMEFNPLTAEIPAESNLFREGRLEVFSFNPLSLEKISAAKNKDRRPKWKRIKGIWSAIENRWSAKGRVKVEMNVIF